MPGVPNPLNVCYQSIVHGGVTLLGTDDLIPVDGEPQAEKQVLTDRVDVANENNTTLYARGNVVWLLRWTRVVYRDPALYPITGPPAYATAEEHAQKYVHLHLDAVSEGAAALTWNGKTFPRAVVTATGYSAGPFSVFSYSAICTEQS